MDPPVAPAVQEEAKEAKEAEEAKEAKEIMGWPGDRNPAFFSASDLEPMLERLNGRYCAKADDSVLPGHTAKDVWELFWSGDDANDRWDAYLSSSDGYVGTTTESFNFNPLNVLQHHSHGGRGVVHELVWYPDRLNALAERDLPALVDGLRNRGSFTICGDVDDEDLRYDGENALVYVDDTLLTMLAAQGQMDGIQTLLRHLGALPDELLDAPGYRDRSAVYWGSNYDDVRELLAAQKRIPNDLRRRTVRDRVRAHPATQKRLQTNSAVAFLCAAQAQHALPDGDVRSAAIDARSVPADVLREVASFAFWL